MKNIKYMTRQTKRKRYSFVIPVSLKVRRGHDPRSDDKRRVLSKVHYK